MQILDLSRHKEVQRLVGVGLHLKQLERIVEELREQRVQLRWIGAEIMHRGVIDHQCVEGTH